MGDPPVTNAFEEGNDYTHLEAWEAIMDRHCDETEWEALDLVERINGFYDRNNWRQNIHALNAEMTRAQIQARNRELAALSSAWRRWKKEHWPEPSEEVPF